MSQQQLVTDSEPSDDNNKMINELKKPCVLLVLFILLNLPMFINLLNTYLPKMGSDESGNSTMMGVIARAMVFVILYVTIDRYLV